MVWTRRLKKKSLWGKEKCGLTAFSPFFTTLRPLKDNFYQLTLYHSTPNCHELVMSNFSFSPSFFYLFGEQFLFFQQCFQGAKQKLCYIPIHKSWMFLRMVWWIWACVTFSSFPTVFSKAFCFRVIKTQDCVVKSQCVVCHHFQYWHVPFGSKILPYERY